jgi:hypothetical protein
MSPRLILLCVLSGLLLPAVPAAAQDPVLGPDSLPVADTIPDEAPVPRGAFIRAVLVPGWGHAHIDEPARGAVFFALQGASWYMLMKTASRLENARDVERRLTRLGRDSVYIAMATDTATARRLSSPAAFDDAVASFPGLERTSGLVESRERHRQDWIVYTLVFTFAAAVDAYVTAHLKEFPADFTASPAPGGGAVLRLSVPVGSVR